jgi:opacity protein-like surface antigen
MKKSASIIVFLLIIAPVLTFGQKQQKKTPSLDFGLYLGGSNYMGEFTKGSMPVWGNTNLAGGLIARYNYGPYLTFKGTAVYGKIEGSDKEFSNDVYRHRRNLSFKSDIVEFSIQGEWNILGYENTRTSYGWSPYLFAGISVFRFNPKTQFNYVAGLHDPTLQGQDGDWIELQPLGTEGQETTKFNDKRRYSLTQLSVPLGAGVKWQLNDNWAFGIDFGVRKTFTDYIDDVSSIYVDNIIVGGASGPMAVALKDRSLEIGQPAFENGDPRGNSKTKDWYMIGGITLTYRILGGRQPCFNF